MKSKLLAISLLLASVSAYSAPSADQVKSTLTKKYPEVKFDSVKTTPVQGIYELVIDAKSVMYTEEKGDYFFPTMIEMKTKRNFGQERTDDLNRIGFKTLPLKDAIKTVRGNGKRVMAVFSDPDCPYCKQLEGTIAGLDDVTIYTFPFPIASLHPSAREKAISIWCSTNPGELWARTLISGQPPKVLSCDNPIDRNIELARKLKINGTPTLIFVDGSILPGAAAFEVINDKLDKAASIK